MSNLKPNHRVHLPIMERSRETQMGLFDRPCADAYKGPGQCRAGEQYCDSNAKN